MLSEAKLKTLRVTLVMPSASPTGGAEEAFCQLLNAQAAAACKWQAIFLEDGPLVAATKPRVEEAFVVKAARTREAWKWWKAAGRIRDEAQRFNTDLILGWMTKGHVYGGLAGWRGGIPAAWFQMGLPEDGLLDKVSRFLPTATVFACSEFVASQQQARQKNTRVTAIPLGVDLTRFDRSKLPTVLDARREVGLPEVGPIIGIVGRLQRWKGMHTLISAMPEVTNAYPQAKCVIVGGAYPAEPEYAAELDSLTSKLGMRDRVIFAGHQVNIPLWVQAMDVFVHASNREPFGIVVLEAMALGKKVVACSPGGPDEISRRSNQIRLFGFDDIAKLSSSVKTFLSEPEQFCEQNVSAASSYSNEVYASKLIEAIQEVKWAR